MGVLCSELRIGNKIQDRNGFVFNVVGIGEDWITTDFESNEGDVWEFNFIINPPMPIELTEEILLKCGFKENKFSYVYEDDTRVSVYVNDDFFFCQIDNVVINNIKHLHQLQNLYYCLAGTELEIEL